MENKKTIFSGIQPTGIFTLGNYIGAIKNWVDLQEDYNCIYGVVDLHAITIRHEPAKLREATLRSYALLMACGIDPDKSLLFIQSHVAAHAELAWILNCYTPFGELGRMTQFKDKSQVHADNINAGLFDYPVLQVADILAYNAHLVPVGEDQKQHLELSRNVAVRFNSLYSETFNIPEPFIKKESGKIMSLADPSKKMSKSDNNPKAFISLLDPRDAIIKKFKSAVTDSDAQIIYKEGKDGINNLITIYSVITGKQTAEIEKEFDGRGYGDFKTAVGETLADYLKPIQDNFNTYFSDKAVLTGYYRKNAEIAAGISERIVSKVKKKIGLVLK